MQEQLTAQEYRRRRRRQLDALVDNAELLIGIAERYSRRRERLRRFCRSFVKGLLVLGSVATAMAALSDKVVELWHWVWSHGGH